MTEAEAEVEVDADAEKAEGKLGKTVEGDRSSGDSCDLRKDGTYFLDILANRETVYLYLEYV